MAQLRWPRDPHRLRFGVADMHGGDDTDEYEYQYKDEYPYKYNRWH